MVSCRIEMQGPDNYNPLQTRTLSKIQLDTSSLKGGQSNKKIRGNRVYEQKED